MSTLTGRVKGFGHRFSRFRWGLCLVLILGLVPHAFAGSQYSGPYTYQTYDDPTGKWTDHSATSASEAVEQAKAYLQEHSKPAGPWTCQVIVYSFPDDNSFTLVSHRDGQSNWNADCNSNFFNDEIHISATYRGYDVGRNRGACDCSGGNGSDSGPAPGSPLKNDPVNVGTGNKYEQDTDYTAPDGYLTFRRFYNSVGGEGLFARPLGLAWRHSFQRELYPANTNGGRATIIVAYRPDGSSAQFRRPSTGTTWFNDYDTQNLFSETDDAAGNAIAYTLTLADIQQTETYFADGRLNQVTDARTGQVLYATIYSDASTPITVAPKPNLLIAVTDVNGRSLHFTYDAQGRLQTLTTPDGAGVTYGFDSSGAVLSSVTYADGAVKRYLYNEADKTGNHNWPLAMTGSIDERGVRLETTTYDAQGRVTTSAKAGGADGLTLSYLYEAGINGTTMTGTLGAVTVLSFSLPLGRGQIRDSSQPCGPSCAQPWKLVSYDYAGHPTQYNDFNNNVIYTTYGQTDGLPTKQVEASDTPAQRTTETTWDVPARVPLTRTVKAKDGTLVRSQAWDYNDRHQVTAECDFDASVATSYACGAQANAPAGVSQTRYTYCDAIDTTRCPRANLLLSVDGPRTDIADVTMNRYYLTDDESGCGTAGGACHRAGDLYTIADALGHTATILTYDKAGRVVRRRDANGVLNDITYNVRGWPTRLTVRAQADGSTSADDATTQLDYEVTGLLHKVTDPDGVFVTYSYDDAHRLIDVADAAGSHLHYTLDAAGNRTKEQLLDTQGTVTWSVSRTYNTLGQLMRTMDGKGQVVFDASAANAYDGNGNLMNYTGANGAQQSDTYDALNRLASRVADVNGTNAGTAKATSRFTLDVLDRLTQVTDPDNLATTYGFDGLSHPTSQKSPDTGTRTATYDVAGNALTQVDAKGVTVTHAYDALGRTTVDSYDDTRLNVAYHFDEADGVTGCSGSYAVGRLTRIVESAVTTTYCYDAQGRVTERRQTQGTVTDTTSTVYTRAGRVTAVATPGDTVTEYGRNALGQITSVKVTPANGTATPVVTAATYLPFGPLASYTLGNGQVVARTYDANYQVTDVTSPALNLHFVRDAAGNITALGDTAGANPSTETYGYDALYRLTAINDAAGNAIEAYTYNKTGDRLSKSAPGLATGTYGYQSGTHWLTAIGTASRTYDANGSTTGSVVAGVAWGYGYDGRGRLTVAQQGGATVGTYTYNALGQRVAKTVGTTPLRFAYGDVGQLLGEYGTAPRDYVWMDSVLVGVVDSASVTFIHADALNTPRAVTDSGGATLWSWALKSNPFGEVSPTSNGGYTLNLRFPGQYFDAESGLNYNVRRDYEPATGRYIQSDALGLAGGTDTYAYAASSPLRYFDLLGNKPGDPFPTPGAAALDALSYINALSISSNREYGGLTYKKDGCFYATEPAPGIGDHVKAFAEGLKRMPEDGVEDGDYHTHGSYAKHGPDGKPVPVSSAADDEYNSDNFSKTDMDNSKVANGLFPGWKSYLSTPGGTYQQYDPATGKTSAMKR
ncbi:RHS repeat-associated protein [Luteibacter rhizovicinus]|uniref:RHS repeat-associated protein n=1 Tax=Luteibacter rhizovicinus TaxID=242606 RepID=A0A4R3YYQ4_9GAMM|nr:RHS repeat-associated core domain-containing protein [Luteibacter rhizovicinus]TCV97790.1 RHS repeat-associated protein [Luteibacter rhizovicinus]